MALTKEDVRQVIAFYIEAWERQNPDLAAALFTEEAIYHERILGEPMRGREAIRDYWQSKVAESQGNISCRLLSLYLDGTTAIAEWQAEFDDIAQGVRKRMREIAVLEFEGARIASLREYWASESAGQLETARNLRVMRPGTRVLTDGAGYGRVVFAPADDEDWAVRRYVVALDSGLRQSFLETDIAALCDQTG